MTTASTTDRAALVSAIASAHLSDRGPLMPVLHEVVEQFGSVAREDVETIATVLNLSVAEVHGVVSFYHDFRTEPPAAHTVSPLPRRGLPGGRGRGAVRRRASPRGQARRRTSRSTRRSSASATVRSGRPAPSTAACTGGCRPTGWTR